MSFLKPEYPRMSFWWWAGAALLVALIAADLFRLVRLDGYLVGIVLLFAAWTVVEAQRARRGLEGPDHD